MSPGDNFLNTLRNKTRNLFRKAEPAGPDHQPEEGMEDMAFGRNRRNPEEERREQGSVPPQAEQSAGSEHEEAVFDQVFESAEAERARAQGGVAAPPREEDPEPEFVDGRRTFDELYGEDQTVISKGTVIRGELQTTDSLRLLGEVWGDIECKSNIVMGGKICGNTTAANAYVLDAQVDGDLLIDDSITVSDDSWILGNLRAQQAEIDGKIKGNIETRNALSIGSTSSIIGNISTDELEIKKGAYINGQISMYSPSKDVVDRLDRLKD